MNRVKFAVVADIHYGPDIAGKLGTTALNCLQDFRNAVAAQNPDLVARLGDDITSSSLIEDQKSHKTIEAEFNQIAAPTYFVDGNHDRKAVGIRQTSHTQDVNGHRFIFWCPNVKLPSPIGLYLPQPDINWLEHELKNTDRPTIVFSHIPLDNEPADSRKDLAWNKFKGLGSYYSEGPKIRKMMEDCGKVVLCMAGHRHVDQLKTLNGIHYITQQSLTQQVPGAAAHTPYNAQGFVEIDSQSIIYKRSGEFPQSYFLPRKPVI
jgi:Icc protein